LNVGDTVTQGEVVGYTGNSGTIEGVNLTQDEPHPHYELWRGDEGYLGEGLSAEAIYPIVAQVFGESSLPSNLR
jgi:murein DD-endopeptidase MepM/ murein hydrolase activator NlpD